MAIYYYRTQIIGRSQNRSAIAAAAYRSCSVLYDSKLKIELDYTKKREERAHSEIFLPQNAPAEFKDRQTLWSAVNEIEKSHNAQLAREFCVAIPNEISKNKSKKLIKEFCSSLAREGMCVDCNIHWKEGNHHAHIMCTTRALNKDGTWADKEKKVYANCLDQNNKPAYNPKLPADAEHRIPIIDDKTGEQKVDSRNRKQWVRVYTQNNPWNRKEKLKEWRARWADCCNRYLEPDKHIDSRSYKDQGIDLIPQEHEGHIAQHIESRGGTAEVCERNREIRAANDELRELLERINYLQQIKEILRGLFERKKVEQESVKLHTPATDLTHRNFDADMESARRRAEQARTSKTRNWMNPDIDL